MFLNSSAFFASCSFIECGDYPWWFKNIKRKSQFGVYLSLTPNKHSLISLQQNISRFWALEPLVGTGYNKNFISWFNFHCIYFFTITFSLP